MKKIINYIVAFALILTVIGCGEKKPVLIDRAEVGDIVTFGKYEGNDIKWKVLKKKDSALLIITEECIIDKDYGGENWENSKLRKWLNTEFLETSFTESQQDMIRESMIHNYKNPKTKMGTGKDTLDKIFLLSVDEVERFYPSADERKIKLLASDEYSDVDDFGYTRWWLRTSGKRKKAVFVGYDGEINMNGYNSMIINDYLVSTDPDDPELQPDVTYADSTYYVRPVMWINLDK